METDPSRKFQQVLQSQTAAESKLTDTQNLTTCP